MLQLTPEQKLDSAVQSYIIGIATKHPQLISLGLDEMIPLTCPHDPETGEMLVLSKKDAIAILNSTHAFEEIMKDENNWDWVDADFCEMVQRISIFSL